jgi:hypothetical protein
MTAVSDNPSYQELALPAGFWYFPLSLDSFSQKSNIS